MGDRERPGGRRGDEQDPPRSTRPTGKPGASSRAAHHYDGIPAPTKKPEAQPGDGRPIEPDAPGAMRGPPDADLAAITAEVLAENAWLSDLDRGQEIAEVAALRVAWIRAAAHAGQRASELPDPAGTIISREKDARRRARQPWHERRGRAVRALRDLPAVIAVGDLTPLLAAEFRTTGDDGERAGREAMIRAIAQRTGRVRLDLRHDPIEIRVELDGARLAMDDGRIRFSAFFGTTDARLLAIQTIYHDSKARHSEAELARLADDSRWLAAALLGADIAEQRQQAVDEFLTDEARPADDSPEAVELRGMVSERRERAEDVRQATAAAVAPLIVVAGFFAIEGATDVFLAVFPFGKVAKLVKGLRRGKAAAKQGKAAAKRGKALSRARRAEIAGALGKDERRFMALVSKLDEAGKLGRVELLALQTIAARVRKPGVVNLLLVQVGKGQADLAWIARKLEDGDFDHGFVEHFMRYDANPTWAQLRGLLDNQLDPEARASAASKLLGFLGEEAGARHVQSEAFSRRFFPRGEPVSLTRGDEALDLMMVGGKKNQMVVGEVKNWSAETWQNPSQLDRLFAQLEKHNTMIDEIVKKAHDREVIGRVLLVTGRGFRGLEKETQTQIRNMVGRFGWSVEVIPGDRLESMGGFIERMRKGDG